MRVQIVSESFEPYEEISRYHASLKSGQFGATAVFVGTMRDFSQDEAVSSMVLEHYQGMTQAQLRQHAQNVLDTHKLLDLLMLHRIGRVFPGDSIVLVATWSKHRAAAFEACESMVEYLKSQAPFWKKEDLINGDSRWVEHNTAGPHSKL